MLYQQFCQFGQKLLHQFYFFQVLFLVVIFGLFHGLVYLPVLLSMIGPGAYFSADRRYQHDKKERDEENGVDNYAMEKQVI